MKIRKNILLIASGEAEEEFIGSLTESFKSFSDVRLVVIREAQYGSGGFASAKAAVKRTLVKFPFISRTGENFRTLFISKRVRNTYPRKDDARFTLSGRAKKIRNAVLRFEPERIICLSSYSLRLALKARKRGGFKTEILGIFTTFTVDRTFVDLGVDAYIIQNEEQRAKLVRLGYPAERIFKAGAPLAVKEYSEEELLVLKTKLLHIEGKPAVLLNGAFGSWEIASVFSMLLDQGDIINLLVRTGDNQHLANMLRKESDLRSSPNVEFATPADSFSDFIAVSDILVTVYDKTAIYKGLLLGKAIVAFAPASGVQENDLTFLERQGLIKFAKDSKEVILAVYDILQGDFTKKMRQEAELFINKKSLESVTEIAAKVKAAEKVQN